jgi:AcrR family transcriptional regulator
LPYDPDMAPRTRETLTRDRIIDAAVVYADAHGIESLSMRKLGAELDVEAMSLYNHVDNKNDIYDGMIDYVFASIPLPEQDGDWQDEIRRIGMAGMDAFTTHPWTVSLLMMRGNFGPASLRFTDRVIATLNSAGFSDEDAHHAWQMLSSHTMGYAFQQATNPGVAHHQGSEVSDQLESVAAEFPNVARLAPLLAQCEYGTEFAFGLDIIVDGLAARLH